MAVVVNWILAVGVGEGDWDVRVMPRVVWIGVLRTDEVRDWVYEFGDDITGSIFAAFRISSDKKWYVRPDVCPIHLICNL